MLLAYGWIHIGTCSWRVDEMIMLRIHDLIYDWYTSSTLVEAPTSSLIDTCFMEDLMETYHD
jgi:hypothetical protein